MIKANEGCCEDAALGLNFYMPCNNPAPHRIASDGKVYRMCDGCADHSVRNRGLRHATVAQIAAHAALGRAAFRGDR